jgi:predicted cobalt transporter CbtA
MNVRALLVRGMLVGALAGVVAFLFASAFGEGPVDAAIAYESATSTEPHGHELVSRAVQSTVGLGTATVVYGVALGGIFALAFAIAYGRIGRFPPRAAAALVGLGGFMTVALVPFLKYPANPPAVGDPDTLARRTVLYLLMTVIAVASAVVAVHLGKALRPRLGGWNATLAAVGAYVVFVGAVELLLPSLEAVPAGFPPVVLWQFRLSSLGTQLAVWATLGLVFGALTERDVARRRPRADVSGGTGA